jgi:hypothetical protein
MKFPHSPPSRPAVKALEPADGDLAKSQHHYRHPAHQFSAQPHDIERLAANSPPEGVTLHELCTAIDSEKPRGLNLTIAIRIAVLRYYMDAATETGHE